MKIEKIDNKLENMIYGTEPERIILRDEQEEKDLIVARGLRLQDTVVTDGFKDIYEYVENSKKLLTDRVMDNGMKAETSEQVHTMREIDIQRFRALNSLLHWIEGQIGEGKSIQKEWLKEKKDGSEKSPSTGDRGSKEEL